MDEEPKQPEIRIDPERAKHFTQFLNKHFKIRHLSECHIDDFLVAINKLNPSEEFTVAEANKILSQMSADVVMYKNSVIYLTTA